MSHRTAPEPPAVRQPGESQTSADLTDLTTRQVMKKKRRSADAAALGVTFNQAQFEHYTLGGGSGSSRLLTGPKARVGPQQAYPSAKKRAKTSSEASWAEYIEWKQSSSLEVCSKTGAILSITWNRDGEGQRDPLSPGSAKRRKFAIEYLFEEVFGSPKEAEWAAPNFHLRLSLPRVIMDMLDVPSSSKDAVITAMWAMSKAHEAGAEYDPSGGIKAGRGAKVLIEDFTPQADVVYQTMESGMSLGNGRARRRGQQRRRQRRRRDRGVGRQLAPQTPLLSPPPPFWLPVPPPRLPCLSLRSRPLTLPSWDSSGPYSDPDRPASGSD